MDGGTGQSANTHHAPGAPAPAGASAQGTARGVGPPGVPASDATKPTLMRNLGAFFGGVWQGIKAPAGPAGPIATRTRVEEVTVTGPDGRPVVLRRTVVDEIRPTA